MRVPGGADRRLTPPAFRCDFAAMLLRKLWYDLRSSFWFVPALMVTGAIVLALGLIEFDTRLEPDFFQRWPRLFGAGAEGARGLLEAIAGSMISVAGVVFSITLVALSLASSQYTSRVLRHFMRDRANQCVLGSFVGIFAYCLVVLRTLRGADEGSFVPALAVLVGLLLGLLGTFVLVFFIHHISTSIQASQILATVAEETLRVIDRLFPEDGHPAADDADEAVLPAAGQRWHPVTARRSGYVEQLDVDTLLVLAVEHGGVVRLEQGIGSFMVEGAPCLSVLAAAPPSEADADRLRATLSVGRARTLDQDVAFGLRQLADVALKALSPGINDSTTAEMSLDRLGAVLLRLAGRPIAAQRRGADGRLRLLSCGPSFEGLVGEALDRVRRNAAGNVAVLGLLFDLLRRVGAHTRPPGRRRVLLTQAQAVAELVARSVDAPVDRARLDARAAAVLDELAGPARP